jgi:hypothetical protein
MKRLSRIYHAAFAQQSFFFFHATSSRFGNKSYLEIALVTVLTRFTCIQTNLSVPGSVSPARMVNNRSQRIPRRLKSRYNAVQVPPKELTQRFRPATV